MEFWKGRKFDKKSKLLAKAQTYFPFPLVHWSKDVNRRYEKLAISAAKCTCTSTFITENWLWSVIRLGQKIQFNSNFLLGSQSKGSVLSIYKFFVRWFCCISFLKCDVLSWEVKKRPPNPCKESAFNPL